MKEALKREKKDSHKKHGSQVGADSLIRIIQHARYADDLILGIVGPKTFAEEVRKNINNFFRSDLHLEVKKDLIVNRNEAGGVKFLGFNVYLRSVYKKTRLKWKHQEAMTRYKRRILAKIKREDEKLSKATFFEIKKIVNS